MSPEGQSLPVKSASSPTSEEEKTLFIPHRQKSLSIKFIKNQKLPFNNPDAGVYDKQAGRFRAFYSPGLRHRLRLGG